MENSKRLVVCWLTALLAHLCSSFAMQHELGAQILKSQFFCTWCIVVLNLTVKCQGVHDKSVLS